MPAEARVTKIWKQQKLFISIFLFAFGLWFYVDGKWLWPASNVKWLEHDRMLKENRLGEWPAYAKSRGWDVKPPEKYHDRESILAQFAFGSLGAVAGAIAFIFWLSQKDRVVKTDSEAVYAPNGTRIPFEAITGLGVKRWESKGFATVRYELNGKKGEFLLDDYKFEREPTHAIFNEIKTNLEARTKAV